MKNIKNFTNQRGDRLRVNLIGSSYALIEIAGRNKEPDLQYSIYLTPSKAKTLANYLLKWAEKQ